MIDKYSKIECNGCKICAEICPKGAIRYETDLYGFWYPKVDYDKCVECSLCIKKCPNKNIVLNDNADPIVKAVWSRDDKVRLGSTSGGLFYELARKVLQSNGYVIGCIYDDDFKGAHHVLIDSMEQLEPLMVSKYVESDTEGIYKKTKEAIQSGKKVLFVGSPCQCAGLKSYLNSKYENLIIVDFLCRGANSPKAHKRYIEYLESVYGANIISLRSKDKRNGWEKFGQSAKFSNGKEYFKPHEEDLRVVAYHHGNLMVRECCANCKFKVLPRYGDITLGDFWGIHPDEVKDIDKGISLCFINSPKGQVLFDSIIDRIEYIDKSLEDAKKGNPAIYQSALFSVNRQFFLRDLDKMPFDKLVEKYKNKEPNIFKKILRKGKKILKENLRHDKN